MKFITTALVGLSLFSFSAARAQMAEPVRWSHSSEKISADEYKITFTAQIDAGWFVYSQFLDGTNGPVKTSFAYDVNPGVELKGNTQEVGQKEEGYDPNFNMHIVKYKGLTQFIQHVKVKNPDLEALKAQVTYMTCNEFTCMPPRDVPFSVQLSK